MKTRLAVLYGGVSVEHEVSVITAVQLMKNADKEKYEIVPVYVDKEGKWWTSTELLDIAFYKQLNLFNPQGLTPFELSVHRGTNEIDVAILCFHGEFGEGGAIQGVLETAGIPYQGPGVIGSAACFDKIMLRHVLKAADISQPEFLWFTRDQWELDSDTQIQRIAALGYPVFVKPANNGSTVGIKRVQSEQEIRDAVTFALAYDDRILIEKEITECIEVNVSVLGIEGSLRTSVPEQPIKSSELLSYADKYERGGKKSGMASATRRIPAPISHSLTEKLQALAEKICVLLDCSGVVRIDFFANPTTEEIFVIEPNTIPGSMSFYLWEASGIPYPKLIDELVATAFKRRDRESQILRSFDSSILKNSAL